MNVGIVGGSGYGGAELLRLLAAHPTLKVTTVAAHSAAGKDLSEVFPHLNMTGTLVPAEAANLEGCDLVFLATPHEASMALAPDLLTAGARVVDLSAAFRLDAPTFEQWYGMPHTAPELAPAVFGLPERYRDQLPGATLIASPGCYPTAAILALAPLAGLIDPASIVVNGMSGTSGAGKGLRDDLHASHAMANVSAYGAPRHRHTPEIERYWGGINTDAPPITFTPHLVPMSRGLVCTASATLTDPGLDVRAAFQAAYADEPFVTLLPEGAWPATTNVVGGNAAHVNVAADPRTGRVTASCAIDNLVKGAAGQAIQAANVALGLPEGAGLSGMGVYP